METMIIIGLVIMLVAIFYRGTGFHTGYDEGYKKGYDEGFLDGIKQNHGKKI